MKAFFRTFPEFIKVVVISLIIVVPIRYFIIQPFLVSGDSMLPNFHNGEYLIIDELSYQFNDPQRGDVIIFRFPIDTSKFYIKRLIGLPNETVQIKNNNIIILNFQYPKGLLLPEDYLKAKETTPDLTVSLDNNQYFVLGDNRFMSSDSRRWGPVSKENIVGRAWLRLWPLARAGAI